MASKEALRKICNHITKIDNEGFTETIGLEYADEYGQIEKDLDKLSQLKDIERELGVDLVTLFKAIENGFYYTKNDEIHFCRWCIRVNYSLIEVSPCYAVKQTTLQSCYYGDVSALKQTTDAHYWDWDTSLHVELKDYGKTWALNKEELENEQ